MAGTKDETQQPYWYFTNPWEPLAIRRGDALGFRASADYFAELLAPGLSNGASDARWISLLSWSLKWSQLPWVRAGGDDLTRRGDQQARYAWLRPLELLWVDRTLESGQTTGQLRGRRSVERWRKSERQLPNFAMSADQFRRYRQVGTYGAYRVLLRTVPGLTTGDGWTLGATGLKLAHIVNESLPPEVRLKPEYFENGTKWSSWSGGSEARYWTERGWRGSALKKGGYLPTPDNAVSKRLSEDERRLLEPALFDATSTRRATAQALAGAKGARSHADLCDALANSDVLSKKLDPASLQSLPAFSRFADAAMHAMRGLWRDVNQDPINQAPSLEMLARSVELQSRFDLVRTSGATWLLSPSRSLLPQNAVVTKLAEAMRDAVNPVGQTRRTSATVALRRRHGSPWDRWICGKA